ncbi:MAG: hypothetical protein V1929_07625 [bacterium]
MTWQPVKSFALAAVLACALRTANGSPAETFLTIGDGWAVVRETYSVLMTNEEQLLVLENVPMEADLSSLSISTRRFQVRLLSWQRESRAVSERVPAGDRALAYDRARGDVTWTPLPPGSPADAGGETAGPRVICRLTGTDTGPRNIDVTYLVTGITWRADYTVLLRGDLTNEEERVSVEISGSIRVMNPSSRIFDSARVRLVGMDRLSDATRNEPGFVMVDDDNPLADLWRRREAEASAFFNYDIPGHATVAAHGETAVPLVSSARQPADRIFRMDAGDLPVAGRQQARPLRKYLVLKNASSYGLGMALPPGDAEIFIGGMRSLIFQMARFARTPANGEVLIDLGPAKNVLGSRQDLGHEDVSPESYKVSYNLLVENRLASPVSVEIMETPPTALAWQMIRAKTSYDIKGRQIIFKTRVEGKSTERVDYTIRVSQPTL